MEIQKDSLNHLISHYDFDDCNDGIHFCWNDDIESLPKDGQPIKVEFTDEDTVYIGPLDNKDPNDKSVISGQGILLTDY